MINRNIFIIIIVAIVVIVGLIWIINGLPSNNQSIPDQDELTVQVNSIKQFVEDFGTKLRSVSLQAPEADLKAAIQGQYSPFITSDLLAGWLENPTTAPGKLTSSTWPDHINVNSVAKTVQGYRVNGEVVELTNNGGVSGTFPIMVVVLKQGDKWFIGAFDGYPPRLSNSSEG